MVAAALGALGTQGALLALINSEQFTNGTYDAALNAAVAQDARALLERNFSDEQRHITWLSTRARELGDLVDPTLGEDGRPDQVEAACAARDRSARPPREFSRTQGGYRASRPRAG